MSLANPTLQSRLRSGGPIVMDGAFGTELTRLGRRIGSADWVEATLGAPDQVRAIHRAYYAAGADLHIANTFATSRSVLRTVRREADFERLNRDAVALCRIARTDANLEPDRQTWIAGSISTYTVGSDRTDLPPRTDFARDVAHQAYVLKDAGCDLIALEMLFDVAITRVMLEEAAQTGLPTIIGLTCIREADGLVRLRGANRERPGLPLADALPDILDGLDPEGPWLVAIMHSDIDVTHAALRIVRTGWTGLAAAYPNSGALIPPDAWDFKSVCSPQSFAQAAKTWIAGGCSMVGGCCGIGPPHIQALADSIKADAL